jgi:prepilin-type N-terminal cleavage/methylation domain-containing protein
MSKQATRGFTIVELLIVIVIVGILAAITIVAYNGIQERARVSSGKAFASQLARRDLAQAAAYWQMDECSGTTISSQTGDIVTGQITPTPLWSTDTPSGSGCSLQLNGSTRVTTPVQLAANYYLKSAWIKLSSCGTNNIISSPDSATGTDVPFYAPSCRLQAGHSGNYGRIQSPNILATNKWYHVAVEFNNGTYTLYEDGVAVKTTTGHPAVTLGDPGVNIGAHRTGSFMTGLIDDVFIVAR